MSEVNPPRIKDIALKAGVSIGTVDRVLHNRGEVARETRERILRIAEEMHYSPNLMARALSTKKKTRIVALLPDADIENTFWLKHHQGLQVGLDQLSPFLIDLEIVLFDLHQDSDFAEKSMAVLKLQPDGVILAPVFKFESQNFCHRLEKENIPFVFVDSFIEETVFKAYVGEDAYQSGRVAAHLIDFGVSTQKDILIVNVAKNIDNTLHLNERTQGFLNYFLDSGKNVGQKICLEIKSPEYAHVAASIDGALSRNSNVGAIFVTSSKAHKIARYLEENNLNDFIVVGYDLLDVNVDFLKKNRIQFLISQRPAEQAEKALKKICDFVITEKMPTRMEYLPVDIISSENVNYFL